MMEHEEPISPVEVNLPPSEEKAPDAPSLYMGYLVSAGIFFALGFLLATSLGKGGNDAQKANNAVVAQAVQGTLIALTPPPSPSPSPAPVEVTFSEQDPVLGSADAPITMVEFSDYRCPYCGRFAEQTLKPLMAHYGDLFKFVYRDYPIFGDTSVRAALAARCADQQGKFWEYHDAVFDSQAQEQKLELTDENLTVVAENLDLEIPVFSACLSDQQVEQSLIQNIVNAQTLLGSTGTPTFLINGQRVVGAMPLENFISIIDAELVQLGIDPP